MRSNADFLLHALEEFQQLLRLPGFVPLIVLPDDLVGLGVDNDRLHRGRANIHADGIDRLEARLRIHFARTGQNARRKRVFNGRRAQKCVQLDVNLLLAITARTVLMRMRTH